MNTTPFSSPGCELPVDDNTLATTLDNLFSSRELDLERLQPLNCDVQQWRTEEGAQVRFVAAGERPIFDLALRFRAGSALDGNAPGLAALTLYSLDQGTAQLDAAQYAEQLEGLGATMSREITRDHAQITLRGLSLPMLREPVLQLLTQMLAQPAFRPTDVEKIRKRLLDYHQSHTRSMYQRLVDKTMGHLFADHPYALSPAGTADGLAGITLEQMTAFHQKAYSANNVDIALVGDFTREDAETLIGALVQALPQHWSAIPVPTMPTQVVSPLHTERPGSNTHILLTQPLQTSPADNDYHALMLANAVLGDGIESRLSAQMRTRRTLTYTIDSFLVPMNAGCLWQVMWDIAPEYRDASLALVSQILDCFIEHGPTQAERELALNRMAGQLLRAAADNALLAKGLVAHSSQGLPADHLTTLLSKLEALTHEDIRLAARNWLAIEQMCFVSLGPTVDQQPLPAPPTLDE